ncbi:MAG: hypothetical protein A2319_02520 [Candidatus Kerfeldbacteria bacterium RIFOXYB2_FULL_38_14]|uniref:Myo-inositol-1-phosphate synthase GAPDH-like domain-containing protein n=1 Tax=Candidatus Kerfeldbacteria bacterium RIFOXYB2_FULL_38_14 TaxID=1798547 RepID=A0A1G2BHT0_9BACT|nr:MAG: hypothetical protein A2319_02520 [Candidatus Kerfeldbacteria bacterium RIFOXYB2_FULL_38_14]
MKKINVTIIGVGSFAKALIEGVAFYTKNPKEKTGLMHARIGNYRVQDLNFVAGFDVDERKVDKKLHTAIYAKPNITKQISASLKYNALVHRGPTLDGVIDEIKNSFIQESTELVTDIKKILKKTKTDVVVNLVPSGSDQATYLYAEAALSAGCSFINCIPTPLATVSSWRKKFEKKDLVLLGDDIKSQLGATMLNRFLLSLFKMRGIKIIASEQHNKGGNADHYNLIYRSQTKEKSKKEALTGFLDKDDAQPKVTFTYTGKPSGHKEVHLKIEGEIFGRMPIKINSVIEDEISINGAGSLVDAIRVAKFLTDQKKAKEAKNVCAFLMKSPPKTATDTQALKIFNKILSQ